MKEKTKEQKIARIIKWIVLFISLVIFLSIVEDIYDKEIMTLDIAGYNLISKYLIKDFVTPIAKFITNFGGAIVLILTTLILLIVLKNKKIGISIASNLAISTGLNVILKNIVQRPRPIEFRLINESGYSFPSGHSMVSMAFYGYLIYLIYKNIENKKIKWSLITFLSTLIFLIGISRIYLGVHYTSDVVAGFVVSLSYLIIYTSVIKRIIK